MGRGGRPLQPQWGILLQQRREARGWSLRWAAQQSAMSDVFWAQMERGYKRRRDGTYQTVTPSLGSLLQAAGALRFTDTETDQLVTAAGYQPLPRRAADGTPPSVIDAIQNDPELIDEAREHLIRQYGLLRRIDIEPSAPTGRQTSRRTRAPSDADLRAVARGGRTEDRAEVHRLAKKAREHEKDQRGK